MRLALTTLVLALALAAPAWSSRPPTRPERAAIELAVRFFPPVGRTNEVRFAKVRVSTVDARYAMAAIFVRDAHGNPVGAATALLRRRSSWRVVAFGTDPPPCSAAPAAVRRDLLGSAICLRGR